MLACERWTLTHSSGWAAVLVGLLLALALLLGLEAMNASRVADAVAEGEVRDDEGEADGDDELVWDGEPVAELDADPDADPDADADADDDVDADDDADADADADAEPEPELEPDGDGDTVLLGVLVGSVADDAGAVGEEEAEEEEEPEGLGEVEDGEGDGDGDFDVGVGVGVGVDVAAAGSVSHLVSVPAPALAELLGLAETTSALIVPACAAPGQPASAPRVTDPPATRLSTAARTCARRMKTALSPLLIEVTACSLWGS